MSELKKTYTGSKVTHAFEYNMYGGSATHKVTVVINDNYVEGVIINKIDSYEEPYTFVFDVNSESHLKLAAAIYEKVCELKQQNKPTAKPRRRAG